MHILGPLDAELQSEIVQRMGLDLMDLQLRYIGSSSTNVKLQNNHGNPNNAL